MSIDAEYLLLWFISGCYKSWLFRARLVLSLRCNHCWKVNDVKTSQTQNAAERNVWVRVYVICKPVIDLSRSRKSSFINSFLITLTRSTKTLKFVWTLLHALCVCVVNSISKTRDEICTDIQHATTRERVALILCGTMCGARSSVCLRSA